MRDQNRTARLLNFKVGIVGLNNFESEVVRRINKGDSHADIAEDFEVDEYDVIKIEMRSMSKLAQLWKTTEAKVKRMLRATFVIGLSVLSLLQSGDLERAYRTTRSSRTARRSTRTRRKDEFDDLLLMDV